MRYRRLHARRLVQPVLPGVLAVVGGLLLCGADAASSAEAPGTSEVTDFVEFNLEELLDVVVSSVGTEQTIAQAPSVISIVTRDDLIRRGVRSLAEALAILPGLSFVDDQLLPNLSVRGVYGELRGWGRFVKVMIDGQPIAFRPTNANWLGVGAFPLEVIERIEVIRGPATTLYGADAFLGVVNVITRKPGKMSRVSARVVGLLTQEHPGGAADVATSWVGEHWHVTAGATTLRENRSGLRIERTYPEQTDDLIHAGDHSRGDIRTPTSAYLRTGYHDDAVGNVTLTGLVQHLQSAAEFQDYSVLTHDNEVSLVNGYARIQWDRHIESLALDVKAFGAYQGGGALSGERTDIGRDDSYFRRRLDYRGGIGGVEALLHLRERDTLLLGTDLYWYDQANPSAVEVLTQARGALPAGTVINSGDYGRTSFGNTGAYAQGYVELFEPVDLTAGVRWDHHNIFGSDVSYRVGVVGSVTDSLSTKLLYGTSVMTPAADQLYSQGSLGTSDIIGNPDLKTQTASTLEAAVDYSPGKWLTLRLAGFWTEVQDKIEFQRLGVVRHPVNRDTLQILGCELEAQSRLDRVTTYVGVGYARGQRERQGAVGIPDAADELFTGAPSLTASVGLHVDVSELYAQLQVEGRYRSSLQPSRDNFVRAGRAEDYRLPAGRWIDLTLSTVALRLFGPQADTLVQLRITNLLDARPSQPGYNGIDTPSLGRAYFLMLRHELGAQKEQG